VTDPNADQERKRQKASKHSYVCVTQGNYYPGVNTTTKVLLGFTPIEGMVNPERKSNGYAQVPIGAGKEGV